MLNWTQYWFDNSFGTPFSCPTSSCTAATLRRADDAAWEILSRLQVWFYSGFHLNVGSNRLSLGPMAAYSIDLRQKILRAWERHLGSQRTIADLFGVSRAFVEKVLRQYRATGDLAPKPHAGGQKPRLDAAAQTAVQRLMGANPDTTLAELCTGVAAQTGVRVSVPTMCRVLQRLGLPRKKSRSTRRSATPRASSKRGRTTSSGSHRSPVNT
jgi:transposase